MCNDMVFDREKYRIHRCNKHPFREPKMKITNCCPPGCCCKPVCECTCKCYAACPCCSDCCKCHEG